MISKANIKGHPLHPILVIFPVAFFTGTLVFDLLGLVYDRQSFTETGQYLEIAGLGSALVAAIPGFLDFLFRVPPESSAKKRAATHGLINVTVLLFFGGALAYRLSSESVSNFLLISLELVGVVLLMFAGWMGGTLIYRNQIGVDIRYAGAGKWKEDRISAENGEVEIGNINELQLNQMRLIIVNEKRIVIAKTETGYAAFDDHCTHRGGSLAAGSMICDTVQCPWHGSQFDVNNGKPKAGPAKTGIGTYPLIERSGKLYLKVV